LSIGAKRRAFVAAFYRFQQWGAESLCASAVVGEGTGRRESSATLFERGRVWYHPHPHNASASAFVDLDSKESRKNWGRIFEVVIAIILIEHVRSQHNQFERGVEVVRLHVTTLQGFKSFVSTYEPWTDACDCPRNSKQGFPCACCLLLLCAWCRSVGIHERATGGHDASNVCVT
jgi:hypothetical protein